MVKTDDYLKVFYINMVYVNCTYHNLNTIAEKVREGNTFLSKRIKYQFKKKSFFKSSGIVLVYIKTFYQVCH